MSLIPKVPGAPTLLKPPTPAAAARIAINGQLLVADALIIKNLFAKSKWGIYKDGQPIAAADSVLSFEYRQDTKVSDHPQEAGAFQSYSKVGTPYDARVQLTKGGSEADRAKFLAAIEAAAASLNLYDVATPEKVYTSATIQRFDYQRSAAAGAGLITVDIWLVQVRVTNAAASVKTKAPSGAATVNLGTVQALPASEARQAAIAGGR